MNTKKLFFIVLAGLLAGCELGQEPQAVRDFKIIDEVKAVLKSELFTPTGKVKSVFHYQGFEHFNHRQDWYYNGRGQVRLTVGINSTNDTTGLTLYGYDSFGMQVLKHDYYMKSGKYQKIGSNSFTYDAEGKLIGLYSGIDPNTRRLIYTYYYNENGFLELIKSGVDQQGEKYIYELDENNRVSKMTWWGAGESPIMEYFYRYNNFGQLEAKETWFGTLYGDPMQDAFQYFYNDKGQLMEEKEFYPHLGFEPLSRKTYEYYREDVANQN